MAPIYINGLELEGEDGICIVDMHLQEAKNKFANSFMRGSSRLLY